MEDLHERLRLIASAQEEMVHVADLMEQWDKAQLSVEKSSFDTINMSDKVLNLSKEESQLLTGLKESYHMIEDKLDSDQKERVVSLYGQINDLIYKIVDIAYASNDVSHVLEREVACQREITDRIKVSFDQMNGSMNQAVACAEFLMAEF